MKLVLIDINKHTPLLNVEVFICRLVAGLSWHMYAGKGNGRVNEEGGG